MTAQLVEQVGELDAETRNDVLRQSVENMTIRGVLDLVKHLEKKWDVKATPSFGGQLPPQPEAEEEKEQTEFDVFLSEHGPHKIAVIKALRVLSGQSLKESKAVIDKTPVVVQEKLSKEDAVKAKASLEEAGATVELR